MSIYQYIDLNAQRYEEEEAIVYIDKSNMRLSLSWGELKFFSNVVANILVAKEIRKGDKVAILLQNLLFWLPIYFGILRIGAVVVPLNYRNSTEETADCIKFAECRGLFLAKTNNYDEYYKNMLSDCFVLQVSDDLEYWKVLASTYGSDNIQMDLLDNEVAALYFSSGTTGKSKAVLLSHGALQASAEIELNHHRQRHSDRFLCVTPLYHTGSKIHWFGSLLVAGTIVIFEPCAPLNILKVVESEKISIAWFLVPQIQDILDALVAQEINIDDINFSSLRLMHSGAQHVPRSLIQQWHDIFPHIMYDTNYGLTEACGPGCIHLGMENIDKAGSVGKPDLRWLVEIVDEYGVMKEKGQIGELIVKGPGVMIEYYKDKKSTESVLKNGWLYTGDMAYMDEDGFIYIVDRKKDIIICGGENIYPVQIENHLRLLDVIKDVAVIGLPNKRLGEIIVAVIELKEGCTCTKKIVHTHCGSLPEYQRPLKIYFFPIRRNATGKVEKKDIRNALIESTNLRVDCSV
jgi:long-chain acyl-CoA synthetase